MPGITLGSVGTFLLPVVFLHFSYTGHKKNALLLSFNLDSGRTAVEEKGSSGKEPTCQCRRHKIHRFDPWVGKISWRRQWQPTPAFLPGEFQGQRSLVGYCPKGCEESEMTEMT